MSSTSSTPSPESKLVVTEDPVFGNISRLCEDHSLSNMNYRQLQCLARIHNIPSNLKKSLLITLIQAKMDHRYEDVEILLKHIKESRLQRKRKQEFTCNHKINKKDVKLYKNNFNKRHQLHTKVNESDKQINFAVQQFFYKMIKDRYVNDATINQTQTESHYSAYVNSVNSTECSNLNSATSAGPQYNSQLFSLDCYPSHPLSTSLWTSSCAISGETIAKPSQCSLLSMVETYHKPQPDMTVQPQPHTHNQNATITSGAMLDPLTVNTSTGIHSPDIERVSSFTGLTEIEKTSNLFCTTDNCISSNPPLAFVHPVYIDTPGPSPQISTQSPNELQNFYKIQLPPFETMLKPGAVVKPQSKAIYQPESSTALECLANTAMSLSQVKEEKKGGVIGRSLIEDDTGISHYNYKDDLVVRSYSPQGTSQGIVTWKNYLEQISGSSGSRVTCKYGCQFAVKNKEHQVDHEAHCADQPIQCPFPKCNWFNQLKGLDTHIFGIHYQEIVLSTEASLDLNFAGEGNILNSGLLTKTIKKLCFLQMVNHRIFVISVLANFQSMQVFVYIQYVNDNHCWIAVAALEVFKQDGQLHQWVNRVYPITYKSMNLVTRRKCLIFNMENDYMGAKIYRLHSKIRPVEHDNK